MKLVHVFMGLVVFFCSILGYFFSPSMVGAIQGTINNYQAAILSNMKLANQQSYFQVGDSFGAGITELIQIGFIGCASIGAIWSCYGLIAKKTRFEQLLSDPVEKRRFDEREQEMIKLLREHVEKLEKQKEAKATSHIPESRKREILTSNLAVSILMEKLERGEITQRQFDKVEPFLR